mmetsp:Transcript_5394/g.11447  ORF Transcript_5394/g.11447 Transcript_5394/m.11447 type:complete len:81 (+) Transcript_5394:56-298(+)
MGDHHLQFQFPFPIIYLPPQALVDALYKTCFEQIVCFSRESSSNSSSRVAPEAFKGYVTVYPASRLAHKHMDTHKERAYH